MVLIVEIGSHCYLAGAVGADGSEGVTIGVADDAAGRVGVTHLKLPRTGARICRLAVLSASLLIMVTTKSLCACGT